MKDIPVARPYIGLAEFKYTFLALLKGEISGYSKQFVPLFEKEIAEISQTKYALAVNSGTSALHLAYIGIGIKPGNKVGIASFTNMATFFPAIQLGAVPIPIDVDISTYNIDIDDLQRAVQEGLDAIVVVHLMGLPANMETIMKIANQNNIPVIEDCAEALGAKFKGKAVGSFGKIGCHSFYANKIITTGEGGAVTTDDFQIYNRMKSFRSLSFGDVNKFIHKADGFNFRMSNIQSAIGFAQAKRIGKIIYKKKKIAALYSNLLFEEKRIAIPTFEDDYDSVHWMYQVTLLNSDEDRRNAVIAELNKRGIESRQGFVPYSDQIDLLKLWNFTNVRATPVATELSKVTLYLPSGPKIKKKEIEYVVKAFRNILDEFE